MKIRNHRLEGDGVEYRGSPNQGGPYAERALDTIIIHYTAGANAESAIRTLSDTERKVSAHLVVGRDGAVTQLVPLDTVAWHAGQSRWGEREGFNQYSIGIEIDNAGQLEERDGRFVSWFGREYPEEEVVWGVHRNQTQSTPWHKFTEVQVQVVEEICRLLVAEYGVRHILGHEEIAPQRKIDPGPGFPLDELRARLLSGPAVGIGAKEGRVRAERLNIRAEAHGKAERVAGFLKGGTKVEILEEKGGWCRVAVKLEGWVSGRYLDSTQRGE